MKREDSLGLGHVEAHAEDVPDVVMRRRSSGKTSEACTVVWSVCTIYAPSCSCTEYYCTLFISMRMPKDGRPGLE